ncbi:MAG: cobaltochelatase subunit CobN [Trichlorobacter sp.]|nr:cobaltochelatase subunit CobN [Trichlorobacter sp.]
MCRNDSAAISGYSIGWRLLFAVVMFFLFLPFLRGTTVAAEQPLKVSLLLGDYNSRLAVRAVQAIKTQYPELSDRIAFEVAAGGTVRQSAGTAIASGGSTPGFGVVHIMDRQMVAQYKPAIAAMRKAGMKVYAVGGIYGKDDEEMELINDPVVERYFTEGGVDNCINMILFLLHRDSGMEVAYREPARMAPEGIYLKEGRRTVATHEEYLRLYWQRPGPWIGITFYKNLVDNGDTTILDSLIDTLEQRGMNVLPVYGYPSEQPVERYFFDENGKSRVKAVIGLSLKVGTTPQTAVPLFSRLGVPVLDAIILYYQSRKEWEQSPVGLDIFERGASVAMPELAGIIQPTVVASRERVRDLITGLEYVETRPIPERIEQLRDRISRWLILQTKSNADKRVALIYYSYPPGKQNIGAAYLNVLPESLFEIVSRLQREGYTTGSNDIGKEWLFNDVHTFGRNIGNWAPAEIDRLARSGKAVLMPMQVYKSWFMELPEGFRRSVVRDWGEPDASKIMTWRDDRGTAFIVLPAVRYGNILLTPQPARGWEQDIKKAYHSITLAPHHQYIAFYLWLKRGFKADAVAHIGTHGTHEWLSGKEVGFTAEDPPELLIQDLPNIYPYIVDDVGEGLQAKRRGMAVVIDHMTPPLDKAGLNLELKELTALINDYADAREKSPQLADTRLQEINTLCRRIGLLTDLKLTAITTPDHVEELDDHIREIGEKATPFGLHTFGKVPEERYIASTAKAVVDIEINLSPEERQKRIFAMQQAIIAGGERELDSFIAALAGRYIPAGPGNDPIRTPESLPTGKNFYSFDPTRVPTPAVYETGKKLAEELISDYQQRHGAYPDKLTFNIWGTETIRHEGVMESQIMYLLGVRPRWDERGRISGVEAIPRNELERGRIDVTMVPSGLYRDLFPNLMALLDQAATVARDQDETDNLVRSNIKKTREMLMSRGVPEERAQRLASVRIFTEPSGAYGTGLDTVITASNTWDTEKQVTDVYFMRMSHLYGHGFWGDTAEHDGVKLGETLLKQALSGSQMAVHSRSSTIFATLDNDDVFQYLGGTAMAIRAIDGKTPEVYLTDMTNPTQPKQETLEKMMGQEMRSRYLNPEWIKAMMKEGYSGAHFVDKVVEHLWGWQVTVPEAVDSAKWQEMYETWVKDRNNLGLKELFRQAKNPWAYQSMVARMLETVRKQYWQPEPQVMEKLAEEYARSVQEVGLTCCDHTCNNPQLTGFTRATLLSVPGLKNLAPGFMQALQAMKQPDGGARSSQTRQQTRATSGSQDAVQGTAGRAPGGSGAADGTKAVTGFEMQESGSVASGASSAPIPWLFMLGFAVVLGLVGYGFRKSR